MIADVLHFSFTVSDIERSVDWYTRVLGLELIHRQRQENEYTPIVVGIPGAVLEVAARRARGAARALDAPAGAGPVPRAARGALGEPATNARVADAVAAAAHGDIRFEPELVERQSTTSRARLNRYSPAGD